MFEKYVAKGAALLDARRPGWRNAIDTSELNLESTYSCVLGQLYDGNYCAGVDSLRIEGELYGFDLPEDLREEYAGNDYERERAFDQLKQEWLAVIAQDVAIRNDWLMDERDAILADMPMTD